MILCAVIADLASAYELRKTDYEYVILEAGARPCGHSGTIRDGARETGLNGHSRSLIRARALHEHRSGCANSSAPLP